MTDPIARSRREPSRRVAVLGLLFVAAILSCGKDVTGPLGAAARYVRGLAFNPVFPPAFQVSGGSGVVQFSNVHVVLHHSDGTVALDTIINFPSGSDSLTVDLTVKLLDNSPTTGEPMTLNLGYLNAAGDVVFSGGPVSITAAPPATPGVPNPPVQVPISYTGPGATAVSVAVSPHSQTVIAGGTFAFSATAKDASGNAVTAPIIWNSLDPSIATISSAAAGNGVAGLARGTARIQAQLLTGGTDIATVSIVLPASQLIAQSGSGQSGVVGTTLANPLVVKVAASDGVGVAGTTVSFAVASGGGSVGSSSAVSDANGLAQTTFKLGTSTGAQSVTASAASLTGSPITFTATAQAATATKLVVTTGPSNGVAGNALSSVVFTAQDNNGNVATTFTGAVSVAFGSSTLGATLGGATSVNAVAGVATFSGLTINKNGTGYTLVASSGTLTSATTGAFDIAVGAASKLIFTAAPTGGTAGAALSTIVVNAQDSQGNPTPAFTGAVSLGLAANPGGGTLSGTLTVNAVAGAATFSGVKISAAGAGYALSASSTGLSAATSGAFTVAGGAATQITLASGNAQTAPISTALAQPIVLVVTDGVGQPVAGTLVTFAVVTGGGSVLPTSASSDALGHVSTNWTLGPLVGLQSITATSVGLAGSPMTITATGTAASAFSKTWTGTTNNQWLVGTNWSPAGVPAATDSILIPITANNPVTSANITVAGMTVNAGATLTLNGVGVTLSDNGLLDASGGIIGAAGNVVLNASPGRTMKGVITASTTTVFGTYTLNGAVGINGGLVINSGGAVTMNGNTMGVTGNFVTAGTGTFTENNAADVLSVVGGVNFGGGSTTGQLTAGVLSVGGNFFQTNTASSFNATGTHLTAFAGPSAQTINFANPGNSQFAKLTIANTGGVSILSNVVTASDLTVASPLTGPTFGLTISGQLIDLIAGTSVGAISFVGSANPVSASTATINSSITFNSSSTLLGNLTVTGGVNVNSASGSLSANGHTLTINGSLGTANSGAIAMSSASDLIIVNGSVTFAGNSGPLTNGVLQISGNFTQNTNATAFVASSPHITRFTGATPTISFANPTTSNFGTLQLQTSGAVTFATNAATSFDIWLKTGTTPSVAGAGTVTVGRALYDTTGGRWQVANTVMAGSATLPRSMTTNLTFSASGVLVDSLKLTGNALINASAQLDMNGHYMKVTGTFGTSSNGTLKMSHVNDSLVVKGNASFNGGSTTGLLTNGYFEFDGSSFVQGVNASAFAADAPHITWFWGSLQQTVAFANSGAAASHFGNLYLQDTATVLNSGMYLNGQLQSGGQASFHIEAAADELVTSNGSNGRNFVFDNVRWKIAGVNGNGLFPSLDNITFQNISATTLPQFDYEYSVKTNLSIPGFNFLTTPTGGGSYIKIVGPDTLTLSSISPASSGGFVNLSGGGAIVGWSNTDTWLGSVSTAWGTAANWSAGVPTAASDVMIGSGSFQPSTGAAITVHSMSVNTGAVVSVTGGALTVTGLIDVGAGAQISIAGAFGIVANGDVVTDTAGTTGITSCAGGQSINLQAGSHNITGKFCNLSLFGTTTATGPIQVVGTGVAGACCCVSTAGGNLIFNGHRVDVTQYNAAGGNGLITMTNSLDTLYLHSGSTATPNFNGGAETGLMTAGAIVDRAAIVAITGLGLDASGTQSFIVDTSFFQTLSWNAVVPGHGFNNLTMKGTASKGFSGDQWITGTLLFDVSMVGPGTVAGSYNIHVNTLIDNSALYGGGFIGGSTALHMTGNTPFNRDTIAVNTLYFDHGQTFALARNLITNYIVVDSNSTLSLNGHTVNEQGNYFTTQNGGMLKMTNAADSLVANQLYFNGGSTSGLLTNGAINVSGSVFGLLYQGFSGGHIAAPTASATAFAPSGTRVWFNPPFGANVAFANPGSGGTGSHFWFVQAANGNPITMQSNVVVDSLLKGEVNGDTWQSDSAAQGIVRTIVTNGIYNSGTFGLTLNTVNVFLNEGAAASTFFNSVTWMGSFGTASLFTQNKTTAGPQINFNNFSGASISTGKWINNIGSASLTIGASNTGLTGTGACSGGGTLSSGTSCP